MNIRNINKFTLKIMLVIIVAQVFAPTIYKAAEVNNQKSVEFATFEDFIFDEDKNEYALEFDADQEIDIDFSYDEDASVEDYDFRLNEKQLDIDQVATTVVGINEVTIVPNVEDARDISSLKMNVAKENLELLSMKEVEDNDQTSEVTIESEVIETEPTKVKAADARVDDFTITKQFVGAKLGGTFAANDDVLTWRLILENNGTVKTNVRALITPDADDVVGAIYDVVVVKNGETLTVGTDYTVKNNDIKLLDPVDAHDTVTIDYSENTVSEFATTTAILDKSFIYADGFANPKQVLKYVGKIPSNAHEIVVHKTVMDRSHNDKAAFGEKLMYTLNVQNTGQVNETNVTILDAVDDPNLDLSTIKLNAIKVENGATITSNTFDSTEGVKVVADMPKGSNVTIRFYVDVKTSGIKQIKSDLERGLNKQIDNTFSVTADLVPDPLTATASIPIDYDEPGMNDLTVNKTLEATSDGDLLADVNEDLDFKITVENKGALVQENVILTDIKSGEFNGEITNLEIKNGTTTLVEGTDYTFNAGTKKITIPTIDSNTTITITYSLKTATVFQNHYDLTNKVSTISDEVTESIKSEVKVPKDLAKNAVIRAEDAEYNVADAPRTNADVLKALGVEARDVDGRDITDDIVIENLAGYRLENPIYGTYPITISVIGSNGVKVTTFAILTIIQDGNPINNIQMLATTPIVISNGSGEDAATVIDNYANAMVIEQIANNPKTQYSVGSATIVSNGGYDNNKNGTYIFKLETTGDKTLLKVSTFVTVIVTDDPTNADASATIDGQDIKVLKGSAYTNDLAVLFHKKSYDKVTAEVTQSGAVTPIALSGANVAVSNVDTSTAGVYNTVFSYNDKATFAKPVETVKTLKVTVVEKAATNAVISASDLEIDQPFAPTTNAQLITDLRASAKEVNGTDLTSAIKVSDLGGYNLAAPAIGEFVIQFSVTGADGVIVTTSANLKVVTDGAPYNAIDMTVTTPIVIANGSGDNAADVINKYGFPMVTETMAGEPSVPYSVGDETIVSNGGYDNNTNGTYIFKLQTTGIESTLTVSRLVTVIVTDNPNTQDANAVIDGKDIKVLKGSYYDDKVAVILHAKSYDNVTAKVTEKGTLTPVTLSDSNVLVKNVNTNTAGVYSTTFAYANETRFTTPVEAVRTLKVTVVEKAATNAVISASDLEVDQPFAPTTNAQLITDLRASAKEANGTDLTSAIKVSDLGGYNLAAPATGEFVIQFSVTGADGVIVTTSANLNVVTDGAPYNAIDMTVTTPIVIANGSGDNAADVINKYGFPMVTETMAGEPSVPYSVGDETIVSNGGYDNNTNGTYIFKLQTTGIESTLTVSRLVTVIVTDNPNTQDANAVIDGKDIKVLKGSYYDDKVAVILHAKSYDNVTAKVTEKGTVTPVTLSDSNVLVKNVNTNTAGVYTTTFAYANATRFTTPVEAVKTLKVTVVEKAATNAVISASDLEVDQPFAPTTNAQLITDLRANAKEANGTDLTSAIKVSDLGGYNLAAPATGEFVIQFSVTGADGVIVTTSANLKVVTDGAPYNAIDMTVTTPIVIANGSGDNAADVINKYGFPMVTETMAGEPSVPYSVSDETIVSNGGYDNNTNGTYIFKLQTTGIESTLTVSRLVTVIVTDNPNTQDANAVIDGKDIKVLKGSYYDDKVAVILHAKSYDNVTAKVTEKGTVTPVTLSDSNVLVKNVNTNTAGVYTTTFAYANATRFTTPVEAVKTLKVTVVEKAATNAVISASDLEIDQPFAPTTNAQLITDLRASAKEANGTDLTSAIKVSDLGGYNLAAPATGEFVIQFSVTGADGVIVTTSANLKVVTDGAPYNAIDMTVTTPIVIANGSGDNAADVINKYGFPMVTETMAGEPSVPYSVGDETIVSNGGYDNNTNGTYIFKLQTTGIESTLTVSRLVTVIVTDNPNTQNANAVIDGKDIKVLKGSYYDDKVAVILHAKSYDNVTAKVTEKGTVTPVTLSDSHVIASNVKEDTVGVYSTTFAYADDTRFTTPVEAVRTLKVTVVDKTASNAVISATDTEVILANAPKTVEDVLTTINANAKEANGTDLTSAIKIIDFGGYNVASPAIGNFTLVLSVVGNDGVVVTTNVVLKVVSNGVTPNEIEMVVTSPITIVNGSGENAATVINKYGNPMVIETMSDKTNPAYAVDDKTIVSDGGYDNNTNGTYIFKLETTGKESGLKISTLVTVIVTDTPETVDSYATIDGQDITVLQGSFYSNKVATVLHNNNYEFVTAEISQRGAITPVSLYAANIIESNVKTNIAGEYTTTYMYADATKYAAPVEAVRTLKVTVVPSNEATNAVLSASDAEVDIENAPTSNEELRALINAKASEANGDDLTEAIIINTMGGYSFTTPAVGEYTIGLSVVGKDGVKVVEIVTLKVMDAGATVNGIEMLVTTPIVIANGSGENAAAVIDNYANAMVQENVGGAPQRPYAIDSKAVVSSGGYDNNTNGTYIFKLETIGNETDLKVSRLVTVIVTDDPTTVKAYATIDGKDIKILKGSAYDGNLALILHRNTYDQVTAEVSENGTKTPVSMAVTDIVDSNVNQDKIGQYTTTFKYVDDTTYATPVSAVKSLKVTVVDKNEGTNAIISGTDTQVELTTAPKTTADLLNVINADAVLVDGTNVANQILVIDTDGYDLTSPAEGEYKITIGVFGTDGVLVTTEVNLEVLTEKEEINEIDMLITTPVVVELGNGMDPKAVIEQLIYPTVVETEKGKVNLGYAETGSTLVSAGGYDNNVAGTYYFKLQATGVKTGLEVERLAKVIVTDNSKQDDVNAMIDGRDIELLVNSKYDVDNVALLHANNYDQVTAEINAAGTMDSVALAGENVVASTVNVKKPGTYQTIFYYKEEKARSVTEEVTAVKPLLVKVVDASEGADKIDITKTVQSQDGKAIVSDNGTLNYTINVKNTSPDLVFNELTLADDLANSELNIANVSDVKVTDKNGTDVTADYEISLDNKIAVMINTLRPNDELNITFNIKLDDDVTVKTIDNTATMTFDGKSKKSNTAKINTDYSDKVTPNEETSSENKSNEETSDETIKDNETKSENQQMKIANTGSNELFIMLIAFSAIIIIRFKRS